MHALFLLLPIITYAALVIACAPPRPTPTRALLAGLIRAHILFFILIALSTELLSAIDALSPTSIRLIWSLAAAAATFAAWHRRSSLPASLLPTTPFARFALAFIALILLGTLASALLYPPSNWDSMTYHLARVMHWKQNQSIAFYPTNIWRQNLTQPLAEEGILHLFLLAGDRAGEQAAFLIQWLGFASSIACAPLIAAELGLNRNARIASAIVAATIPMAILQSSGTQNDVVAGSLLMAATWLMLRLLRRMRPSDILLCGLALGLALLTKGTSHIYIVGIGFAIAAIVLIPIRRDLRTLGKRSAALMAMLLIAIAVNGPYLWRCASLASAAGSAEGGVVLSRDYSPAAMGAGIVRNLALHGATPVRGLNEAILHGLERALGAQAENPATTYPGTKLRVARSLHEDTAGNLMHVGVAALGLAMIPLALRRRRLHARVWWYALGLACSGLLFCVLLRWQPWGSRLHTPLFMLAAPLLTMVAAPGREAGRTRRWIGCLSLAAMAVYCIPFVVYNATRPLASSLWRREGRDALMFQNRPEVLADYQGAVKSLVAAGVDEAGLCITEDDWEYPLWTMTQRAGAPVVFTHVGITNSSRIFEIPIDLAPGIAPAYLVGTKDAVRGWPGLASYDVIFESPSINVYRLKH